MDLGNWWEASFLMQFQRWNVCLEVIYFIEQMVVQLVP
jgi:hypothetical protein